MIGIPRKLLRLAVWIGSLAILAPAVAAPPPDLTAWRTYRDRAIGLELRYPPDAGVKELMTPDGEPTGVRLQTGDWSVSLRVHELGHESEAVSPADTARILQAATRLVQGQCTTDSPDSSVSCPAVLTRLPFTTRMGWAALELYLAEETILRGKAGQPDTTETRTKGPIYVVDVSTSLVARVLVAAPDDRMTSREHWDILRAIADTVHLVDLP